MFEDLALSLDRGNGLPLYRQVVDYFWQAVVEGQLEAGQKLPTVRQLAIDFKLHPDTVGRAYDELELLGVFVQRPGEGTFVGLKTPDREKFERRVKLDGICRETISQAAALKFSLEELIEAFSEFRHGSEQSETERKQE
ncbi:MAG: GntR family transcriptional regulator [Gemmatimonadota bacterium]|nr:GntR family transcriptional regulator [Gemmatimonadota bacterium]MDH5804349.1 GntR family transcriptional regulator [Gemmatimonadota bacterium]